MLLKYKILAGVVGVLGLLGLGMSQYRDPYASLSLHGVNYSDREFSYFIAHPKDPNRTTGGEHINPFSGGGTTCCALLPWKWKPGTKLRLTTRHWLEKLPNGKLPEVTQEHEIEVPQYAEAGELWVIRDAGGEISLVSSNVQPDHPKWPGRIKGWPVPSLEYQRERWEIYRNTEQTYVNTFNSLLQQLEQDPAKQAKEAWAHDQEYRAKEIKGFKGPEDPRYLSYLKKRYMDGLAKSEHDLQKIMEAKP